MKESCLLKQDNFLIVSHFENSFRQFGKKVKRENGNRRKYIDKTKFCLLMKVHFFGRHFCVKIFVRKIRSMIFGHIVAKGKKLLK